MQCGEVEIVTDLQYIIKYKTLGLNSLQAAEVFLFPHHDSATNYFIFLFCTQGLLFGHLGAIHKWRCDIEQPMVT